MAAQAFFTETPTALAGTLLRFLPGRILGIGSDIHLPGRSILLYQTFTDRRGI